MKTVDKNYFLILLSGLLMYVPFLGHVNLFDWDEINFAEAAREMIVTHDYLNVQINFLPFWEKPPFFIWTQVLSMKIFGVNEFAARFPNAVVGIVTLLVIYSIGKKISGRRVGLLWVLAYSGSVLPQFYFKSGIIDPTFNLFIFLSIYSLFRFLHDKTYNHSLSDHPEKTGAVNYKWILLSGTFTGLAVLTKGPVAYLVLFLCWFLFLLFRRKNYFFFREYILLVVISLAIPACWFGLMSLHNGWDETGKFIAYQYRLLTTEDAGHGGPVYFHPLVLLFGCFPASMVLFMVRKNKDNEPAEVHDFRLWMIILLVVVLCIFSIVKTKIVHYSSLCYFPITFLTAYILHQPEENLLGKKLSAAFSFVTGLLFSIVLIVLPLLGRELLHFTAYIQDKFAQANMQAQVEWTNGLMLIGNIFFLFIVLSFILQLINRTRTGFVILFLGTIVMVQLTSYFIVPKIEKYSQAAAIDFYKSKSNEDCYVEVYGFKSYAYLFYTNKQLPTNQNHSNLEWLLTGEVDKPVYIVGKITSEDEIKKYTTLEKIGEKNGFVFYKRKQ